ncbi:MAG: nicotinate-nucleotide adenylyltransferase [Bacteroidetes bacterium]|nr:nicotinate-nucleotide adenylyltransferase [Bacteroidota bacterium]
MKKVIVGLFILGLTTQLFAQNTNIEELPTVVLHNVNYKYLSDVNINNEAQIVEFLQNEVASFNLKNTDVYDDEESKYEIYFMIPDGYILANYNNEGKITSTLERFNNSKLPPTVLRSVTDNYPGWSISKNTYSVTYNHGKGAAKSYKLILENGDQRIRVKTDGNGKIL